MKKRVLVVDDDAFARMVYRGLLETAGFEVAEAEDGTKGLEASRKSRFDLVIVDMFMPGLSGAETIRAMDPRRSRVPVLAVSGTAGTGADDPMKKALAAGASAAVEKGFDHDVFLATVQRLAGGSGPARGRSEEE